MTEQTQSTSAGMANTTPPMPSLWRRSVALALFFTLAGPIIGTAWMILTVYLISFGKIDHAFILAVVWFGLLAGTPFAAVCGVIVAIRAAFIGRINIGDAVGAALLATVTLLVGITLHSMFYLNISLKQLLPNLLSQLELFGLPSVFAAIICRWLFYMLFWPRRADDALK